MLYNSSNPRGINARVAAEPWGPRSDPVLIFDPGWPGIGYGHFMHVKGAPDGLSDPGREGESGGEYGPYLICRFTKATSGEDTKQSRVYFVMSTWNPYNTVLMAATISGRPTPVKPGKGVVTPARDLWSPWWPGSQEDEGKSTTTAIASRL
jgi:Domain of unknown function (DUF4185)